MLTKYQSLIIILVGLTYIAILIGLHPTENDITKEAIKAGLQQKKIMISNEYRTEEVIIWSR
jgi:hypothetical protein